MRELPFHFLAKAGGAGDQAWPPPGLAATLADPLRQLAEISRGERCGRLERSSSALGWRSPSIQRCHHRWAVAGDTLKAAAAALSVKPSSIARTNANDQPVRA